MFKQKESLILLPEFVVVDEKIKAAIKLVSVLLTADNIPLAREAFAQVEEVLKKKEEAALISRYYVNKLLVLGTEQYRTHYKHMLNENICKDDVFSLHKCVTSALMTLFENPVLAKKASSDILRRLIHQLFSLSINVYHGQLKEGMVVFRVIIVLVVQILETANPTHVVKALIMPLSIDSVNISDEFIDVVIDFLRRMACKIPEVLSELNIDEILVYIHIFFKAFPFSTRSEEKIRKRIRAVQTIIFKLVRIKETEIMRHLSLITDRQESDLVRYLRFLSRRISNCKSMTDIELLSSQLVDEI